MAKNLSDNEKPLFSLGTMDNCSDLSISDSDQNFDSELESENSDLSDLSSDLNTDEESIEYVPLEKKKSFLFDTLLENTQDNLSEQILNLATEINWKSDLKDIEIDSYQKLYDKICDDISYVPKISDVLKLSMPYNEKCELFEKIILLNNMTPMTVDFYELKKYLNNIINEFKRFSIDKEEYEKYEKLEKSLVIIHKPKPVEYQILDMNISDYNKASIYQRYKNLKGSDVSNQSHIKMKRWIDWMISIPTNIKSMSISLKDSSYDKNKYLWDVKNLLDAEIYGLEAVKERILFLLNNKITNKNSKGLNFALSGPPGVAKTSIINVLSKSIDLPFFQINAAGMKDSSFLLGHNFTYEGSTPGAIVRALASMKCKNGIIYFDEFDKISTTDQGIEISQTLLHITDFSQNDKFHDRYISEQIDIDLSNIWFIYSLNDKNLIDSTLRDRISIIEIEGYDLVDKRQILKKFLLPAALKNINLDASMISITDAAVDYLIELSCDMDLVPNKGKSGVRQLKQLVEDILMKINFLRTTIDSDDKHTLHLSFGIKNFQLPLQITEKIINGLYVKKTPEDKSYMNMYA